eukprot:jgi/Mesvir1/22167/Mv18769-RA.1
MAGQVAAASGLPRGPGVGQPHAELETLKNNFVDAYDIFTKALDARILNTQPQNINQSNDGVVRSIIDVQDAQVKMEAALSRLDTCMRPGRAYIMRLLTYTIVPAAMLALMNTIVSRIVVYNDETQTERFQRYRRNSIMSFVAIAVPSVIFVVARALYNFHDMAWALVPLLTTVPMLMASLKARKDVLGVGNGQTASVSYGRPPSQNLWTVS